jgi:hypothetical protein
LQRMSPGWTFPMDQAVAAMARNFQLVDGLSWHPDGERLAVGYELYECEPWVGTVTAKDIRHVLKP